MLMPSASLQTENPQRREQRILECAARLPSPPDVVLALIGAIGSDAKGADAIARLVERDQALTARVLKLANSSFYGIMGRIGTARDAVVILGFSTVCKLVVSIWVAHRYATPPGRHAGLARFWRHGMLAAVCASALAQRAGADEGIAFTGGLLHDIGKLVLANAFPDEALDPLSAVAHAADPRDALAQERVRFGRDHASLGGLIAERWRFPAAICTALRDHHDMETRDPLARLIGHADRIAHALTWPAIAGDALQAAAAALVALDVRASATDLITEIEQQTGAAAQLFWAGD